MAKKTIKRTTAAKKADAKKTNRKPVVAVIKKEIPVLSTPSWNIHDAGDIYKVRLLAPGLKLKDIKIGVTGRKLTISCSKEKKSDKNYLVREYNYSSWSRSAELPKGISPDGIDAKLKNGILRLDLRKLSKV